jgi:alpha-beta hydrolase superfamily lysophospholipase
VCAAPRCRVPSGEETCVGWPYVPDATGAFPGSCSRTAARGAREQRLDAYAERFGAAGLAALVFDYRHFGASAGEPRQLLDITRQLADWAAAIAFVRSRACDRPGAGRALGRVVFGGHVMETAVRDRTVAAVVAQVPFADGLRNLRSVGLALALRLIAAACASRLAQPSAGHRTWCRASDRPVRSAMTTPDAEPGFRAIDPPGSTWRNQAAARIALRVGSYRPGRHPDQIAAPILFAIAADDAITPAIRARAAAARAPRRGALLSRQPSRHLPRSHVRTSARRPTGVPHASPAASIAGLRLAQRGRISARAGKPIDR